MSGLNQVLGLGLDTEDGDYSVKPQGIFTLDLLGLGCS